MSKTIGPTLSDRILAAVRAILRQEDANRTYKGVYEYVVQNSPGGTVDAVPNDASIGLPGLTKVPLRTGVAGTSCKPAVGSILAVSFLNGDPTKPWVLGGYDSSPMQNVTINGGTGTGEHVTTIEAISNLLVSAGVLIMVGGSPTPITDATLAAGVATAATSSVGTLTNAAIKLALAAKVAASGSVTSVGCPNVNAG